MADTDKKVWLITGAGRGMGVEIARAALVAGNAVVATGRNTDTVTKADAEAAVRAAVDRFGRIDVLPNDAANTYIGYFEELLPDVLEGRIEPGRVFDRLVSLDGVPDGYRAMDDREAIKVMVRP